MPRKPRELLDGGIYHVFNRGNDLMNLFHEDADYQYFIQLLLINKRKMESEIYHYCLMTNHFHILLKIKEACDLPMFMHSIQLAYARYFKKKYKFLGHLFQQRFKGPRISEESYYLQCGRYIERNPLKANMVQSPEDYAYSSARFYVLGKRDDLLTPNLYYEVLGFSEGERQLNYQKFLAVDEPYRSLIDNELTKV